MRMQARALDVSTVTLSAAADLFLLAEGDMFVGEAAHFQYYFLVK